MREVTFKESGRRVGDGSPPYFVAELNTSHFGNMEKARHLVREAMASGANCVKFQSWSPESLYSQQYLRDNPVQARMLRGLALSEETLRDLATYCYEVGMDFASTPYSLAEAQVLASIPEVPFIKIASMDLVNIDFLSEVASLGKPIVLSTGMSHLFEVDAAVQTLTGAGCEDLVILHCVSIYPTPAGLVSLRNIEALRDRFPEWPIGFSDHTLTASAAVGAVALGVSIIEKHLTADRSRPGMDNQMAMEPSEFKGMVDQCLELFASLGTRERVVSDVELEQRIKMHRSLVVARNLPAGHALMVDDLTLRRPGSGIPPSQLHDVVGSRLQREVRVGELIDWEMLSVDDIRA